MDPLAQIISDVMAKHIDALPAMNNQSWIQHVVKEIIYQSNEKGFVIEQRETDLVNPERGTALGVHCEGLEP